VLVVGPASWNTTVRLAALPVPQPHTTFAQGWADGLGGTSAGKALTLAALGIDVALRTVLGDDDAGARVRDALAHPRITLDELPARDGGTERHVNLVDPAGGRVSVYLTLPEPREPVAPARLDGIAAVVADLAGHTRSVLAAARAAGVPVWCDVHDDDGTGDAYPRQFTAAADVVVASDVRLDDPAAYLRARVGEGARLAVVTRGAAGALALDAGGRWYDVGAAPVAVAVQAEGAGDAFTAGLLRAMLDGDEVARALAVAAAAGGAAVTSPGLGAPDATLDEVRALADRVLVASR